MELGEYQRLLFVILDSSRTFSQLGPTNKITDPRTKISKDPLIHLEKIMVIDSDRYAIYSGYRRMDLCGGRLGPWYAYF